MSAIHRLLTGAALGGVALMGCVAGRRPAPTASDMARSAAPEFRVEVVDARGAPVPQARIELVEGAARAPVADGTTGTDGTFVLPAHPSARRIARVTAAGCAPAAVVLDSGSPSTRVCVAPGVLVRDQVLDLQGRAIEGVPVILSPAGHGPRGLQRVEVRAEEGGHFRAENVPPTDIEVWVVPPGQPPRCVSWFDAAQLPNSDLRLDRAGARSLPSYEPRAVPTGPITEGRVVDAEGRPIAAAWVQPVGSARPDEGARDGLGVWTHADGTFRVVGPGAFLKAVAANPRRVALVSRAEVERAGRVRLVPRGLLDVTLDGPDGRPVPFTPLVLRRSAVPPDASDPRNGRDAWTDTEGRASLEVPTGVPSFVHAVSPFLRPCVVAVPEGQRKLRIEAESFAPIHGIVTFSDGAPARRVLISVEAIDRRGRAQSSPRGGIRTDLQGHFAITRLPPERYRIEVHSLGEAVDLVPATVSPIGTARTVRIVVERPRSVRGHVTGPDGTPVDRAILEVTRSGSAEEGFLPTARTDASGAYRLDGLAPGPFDVNVFASVRDGDRRRTWARQLRGVDAADGRLDVVLGVGRTISGTVVDERGAPVRGLRIDAVPEPMQTWRQGHVPSVRTDDEGRFALTGLDEGPFLLCHRPWWSGWRNRPRPPDVDLADGEPIPAGTEGVRLTFAPGPYYRVIR